MKLWPDGPIDLFARNIENQQKWAPRHNESDLTRTKWWDGGGSTYQNFTNPARITKNESLKCETECFTSICALFYWYLQSSAPAKKMSLRHLKHCACHAKSFQNKHGNSFTNKYNFEPFKTPSKSKLRLPWNMHISGKKTGTTCR